MVFQEYPAISSTPNLNMGDCKGCTRLSPPSAYPDRPWGRDANNGNVKPRHHVYAINSYSSPGQTLSQDLSPSARTPFTQGWMMIPQANDNENLTLIRTHKVDDNLANYSKEACIAKVQAEGSRQLRHPSRLLLTHSLTFSTK